MKKQTMKRTLRTASAALMVILLLVSIYLPLVSAAAPVLNYTLTPSKGTVVEGDNITYEVSPFTFEADGERVHSLRLVIMTENIDSSRIIESIELPKSIFTIDGEQYGISYGLYDIDIADNPATHFPIDLNDDTDYVTITRTDLQNQENGKIPNGWFIIFYPIDKNGSTGTLSDALMDKFEMSGPIRINKRIVGDATDRLFPTLAYPYSYTELRYIRESTGEKITNRQFGYSYFATYGVKLEQPKTYLKPGEETVITHTITNTGSYPITRLTLDLETGFDVLDDKWVLSEDGSKYTRLLRDDANKVLSILKGETYTFETRVKVPDTAKIGDVLHANTSLYTYGNENTKNFVDEVEFIVSDEYTIVYNDNGASAGTVPESFVGMADENITIADNSGGLVEGEKTFAGWNTKADGSGIPYTPRDILSVKDVVLANNGDTEINLYAQYVEPTTEPEVTTTEPEVTTTDPSVTTTDPSVTTTDPSVTTTDPEVTTTDSNVTTTDQNGTTTDQEESTDTGTSPNTGDKAMTNIYIGAALSLFTVTAFFVTSKRKKENDGTF